MRSLGIGIALDGGAGGGGGPAPDPEPEWFSLLTSAQMSNEDLTTPWIPVVGTFWPTPEVASVEPPSPSPRDGGRALEIVPPSAVMGNGYTHAWTERRPTSELPASGGTIEALVDALPFKEGANGLEPIAVSVAVQFEAENGTTNAYQSLIAPSGTDPNVSSGDWNEMSSAPVSWTRPTGAGNLYWRVVVGVRYAPNTGSGSGHDNTPGNRVGMLLDGIDVRIHPPS